MFLQNLNWRHRLVAEEREQDKLRADHIRFESVMCVFEFKIKFFLFTSAN